MYSVVLAHTNYSIDKYEKECVKILVNEKPNNDEHTSQQGNSNELVEKIQQLGQNNLPQSPDSNIHVLSIIGQIEGHVQLPAQNKTTKYEHILPQLIAIEQNPKIEGLIILLNTIGGDVEAGLALSEM